MGVGKIASSIDIAISGLRAESLRMKVIAGNIANANTTRTEAGEPYRRREVSLSTRAKQLGGVQIDGVVSDLTRPFKKVFLPGHQHADAQGMVLMPNVDLPVEMMNLVIASRAYQANTAVLKRYQSAVDVTLELLR